MRATISIILAACMAAGAIAGCATGSHTITGKERAPIAPEAVTIYQTQPANAQTIGIVSARGNTGGQIGNDHAVLELKSQAASMGANGVVISTIGVEAFSGWTGHSTVMTGQAVYVPQ